MSGRVSILGGAAATVMCRLAVRSRARTDRIADSGAELTDENLWIDRSHTGDRAGLNANQEIAVSAYVLGSGGGLPVG